MPHFDTLLEFLKRILDGIQVEQVCIRATELAQYETRLPNGVPCNRMRNKFLHESVRLNQSSNQQRTKLESMVSSAISVLNMLIKLALVDDAPSNKSHAAASQLVGSGLTRTWDWTSKRCSYIRDLRCVQ